MQSNIYKIFLILFFIIGIPLFSGENEEESLVEAIFPDQISDLIENNDQLIGGVVSPLSGNLCMRKSDLIAKGAQDILLTRTYIAPYIPYSFDKKPEWDEYYLYKHIQSMKGWVFFPHCKLQLKTVDKENVVLLTLPSGISLNYKIEHTGNATKATLLDPEAIGICNFAQELPSGIQDLRNVRMQFLDNKTKIVVNTPDGKSYHYGSRYLVRDTFVYLIEKEVLANGKVLKYETDRLRYPANISPIVSIKSFDPQEKHLYASLDIQYDPDTQTYRFVTNTGQEATYQYERRTKSANIKKRNNEITYSSTSPPFLVGVNSPFYKNEKLDYCSRFLWSVYYGKNQHFSCVYGSFQREDQPHYRVKSLLKPVGHLDSYQPIYDIDYLPVIPGKKGGKTIVKDIDGTKTVYLFSRRFLTKAIQYYDKEDSLKKERIFTWDKHNWLTSIELKDGDGNSLYKKTYAYDAFGNPILETIGGNFSGEGYEESIIKREFSQDGRNLLLKEEQENGETICFSYIPNTNLKTSRFVQANGKILQREFFQYDDSLNLICKIEDDGSTLDRENLDGVAYRKISSYILRQQQPFLHMPEWIIETYIENGLEKLLQKSHLTYNSLGFISQEDIYNAEGEFAYSIFKEYNERGDLLSETNAIGQKALYKYDDRGNQIVATSFSQNVFEAMQYDTLGRLRQRMQGDAGSNRSKFFEYDFYNRLVQETEYYDNPTRYIFDPIANKVAHEIRPSIYTVDGPKAVVHSTRYDGFGRAIEKTDANGHTTFYKYNIYDLPTEITHPDGSQEQFRYNKRGKLIQYRNQEGNHTEFTYDPLGRMTSKTFCSKDGNATEYFVYNGFHLLKKTDRAGNDTHYVYDGAGRLVQERFCGKVIDYVYDPYGRKSKTIQNNGENTLVISHVRDLLGRITETTESSLFGEILHKIQYGYDDESNQNSLTRFIENNPATETFLYDPYKRLIEHKDPSGNAIAIHYNDHAINSLGQRVLIKTTEDPEGICTIENYDPYLRIVSKEVIDNNKRVSSTENSYDPNGNLVEQKDHLQTGTQLLRHTYNSLNKIESVIRAFGTPNSRTTTYTYTPTGHIATKTLPNQTTLTYTYTPTGKLKTLTSSDGQIHHQFAYNKLDMLVTASDLVNQITVERERDAFGNITKESLSTGIEIKKSYDLFDRTLSLDLGPHGKVLYTYDSCYLRSVTRLTQDHPPYTHTYTNYDHGGNLLEESLIAQLGTVHHRYDPQGRQTAIKSPYFVEEYLYNSKGNLIKKQNQEYAYDALSQLTSDGKSVYEYDSLYNRTKTNGKENQINNLNELKQQEQTSCNYDLNGNRVQKTSQDVTLKMVYDPLNRLIEAGNGLQTTYFIYDPLGRRLAKNVYENNREILRETYLYDGTEEIGAITPQGNQQRILGLSFNNQIFNTIAIELDGHVFAPILDSQKNIRILVDAKSKTCENCYEYSAFGELEKQEESRFNPWRYASKRFDPEIRCVYFGKRYYDPELARWLSPDPAGFKDSRNLYQYLLNNPYAYHDPDGQFVIVFPLFTLAFEAGFSLALPTLGQAVAYAALTSLAVWGGTEASKLLSDVNIVHNEILQSQDNRDGNGKKIKGTREKAPYNPGNDPSVCPADGFEWKGNGEPGSGRGAWHNPHTDESLYPDLKHTEPIGPHWDYENPDGDKGRIKDGIIEWK